MTAGQQFLAQHQAALEALFRQYGVERAYAFGSVVKDTFTDKSDVDLLVKFDHDDYVDDYLEMYPKIEKALNRKIDLLTINTLTNPYFKMELNRTAKRIYG